MLAFIKYKHTKNINQSKALEIIAIITPLINNPNLDIISYGKNRCKKINT